MFASVSIDLDGLDCYHAIHGLPLPTGGLPVYELALSRFLALFDELQIPSTLFIITHYLDEHEVAVSNLAAARDRGHELASHTHRHPYNLAQTDAAGIADEIDTAHEQLRRHFGVECVGFRTPGYNVSQAILDHLEACNYTYDSSVFPCPPYYVAKAAVMGGMRLLGRRSGSSMTDPRALLAPLKPYRPRRDAFYRRARPESRKARELWEFPMCVTAGLRFPVIGTSLSLIGSAGYRALHPWLVRTHSHLNLEFHGVDLLDASDVGVSPALVAKQPDLRRPVRHKRRIFRDVLRAASRDYEFLTLAQVAKRLG